MDLNFLYFLFAVLVINLTPGPAMLYVVNTSLNKGVKQGIKAALGVEIGVLFYVILCAFGLVIIFKRVPILYTFVQTIGALYLIYLAYLSIPKRTLDSIKTKTEMPHYIFTKGVMINLANPKIGLFFFSLLPQFLPTNVTPIWLYFLIYGLVFNIGGLITNMSASLLANSIKNKISSQTWFSYVPPILFLTIALFSLYKVFL